jgi:ferredoxin-type protein NapH
MLNKFRRFVQLGFFALFLSLMFLGKAQLWMGFIFLSVLLAAYFGRYYCGWACPINTLISPVNWVKKKLNIKDKSTPEALKSGRLKWLVFILFLIGLSYTIYTITQGRKFPLPLIIIPLGLLTTLFLSEKAWHSYLCPWGVLFSLTARFSRLGIKQDKCLKCSQCVKKCPADAIVIDSKKGAIVNKTNCLLCFECNKVCSIDSLKYKGNDTSIVSTTDRPGIQK